MMDLLYALSDGTKTDMDAWDNTDVVEFFMGLWVHQERIDKQLKKLEETKIKRGRK